MEHYVAYDVSHLEQAQSSQADPARLKPGAQLTLMRYLQDLPDAEVPHTDPEPPRFHTGRLPNSKAGDGKPRLLLMGQRRYALSVKWCTLLRVR